MAVRVLVTRPQPGNAQTCARLAADGYAPIALPLTQIVSLTLDVSALPRQANALVATSANALRHAPEAWLREFSATTLFAVGAHTAEVARGMGFFEVVEGPGDAGRLADMVAARVEGTAGILYLCGRVRLSDIEARLRFAGIGIHLVETYDTVDVSFDPARIGVALGSDSIAAVLVHSAHSAGRIAALAAGQDAGDRLAAAHYFCLSPRVAAALSGVAGARIHVSRTPTEDALLACLGARFGQPPHPALFSA